MESQGVNLDSKTYHKQQVDFRNRNNYIRSHESAVHKIMDSEVTLSSISSSPDDLGELNKLSHYRAAMIK